jgi:hypothetical protein
LPTSELSESFNQEQLEAFLQDVLNGNAVVRLKYNYFPLYLGVELSLLFV